MDKLETLFKLADKAIQRYETELQLYFEDNDRLTRERNNALDELDDYRKEEAKNLGATALSWKPLFKYERQEIKRLKDSVKVTFFLTEEEFEKAKKFLVKP